MSKYVAYFRVSTARQGQSGLGLEGQQDSVQSFLPSGAKLVADYIEVESGRKNTRPQLLATIRTGAVKNAYTRWLMAKYEGRSSSTS